MFKHKSLLRNLEMSHFTVMSVAPTCMAARAQQQRRTRSKPNVDGHYHKSLKQITHEYIIGSFLKYCVLDVSFHFHLPSPAALFGCPTTRIMLIPDSSRKVMMYYQLLSGINSSHKDAAYAAGSNVFIPAKVVLFSKLKEHKVPLSRDNVNSSPQ